MRRIWLVFWHTYREHITRKSYLFFTFGLPLYIIGAPLLGGGIMALVVVSAMPPTSPLPVGVVDHSGILSGPETYPSRPVDMLPFDDAVQAAAALESGEIQGYYEIPADYWQTGTITLTYDQAPSEFIRRMFGGWLRAQVRAQAPPDLLTRYTQGAEIVHRDLSETSSYAESDLAEWMLVFALIYFARLGGTFTAGHMYDSIASEARERTIEILITSVTPAQFIYGKLLGLLGVSMTQLAVWGGMFVFIAAGGAAIIGFDAIGFLLGWEHLPLLLSVLVGAYVLDQVIAAAAGMLRVSGGAGPQLFNVVAWIMGLGLFYGAAFIPRNPDTPLAVAATLFPLTMPVVLPIRIVASQVPGWQIVTAQLLLWGTIAASVLPLRWLLRLNLVSYAPRFNLIRWTGGHLARLRQWMAARKVKADG